MTHLGDTFEPDPKRHRLYTDLYEQIYRRMYRRLQPLYHAIAEIIQ
jgi:sugar (pentulose or hexulose) kinase